ncbi:MAG: DUF3619 family protein [Proteobacteria bacterium]|nr:DUF3619 family protein [Pseudomonadota bacterium]MCA0324249.1 DUF3619 family protein [Pseudomonadota bacterium]
MSTQATRSSTGLEALEAHLGARLAASLNERAIAVPHDIAERLRISREQAVAVARQARQAHAASRASASAPAAAGAAVLAGGRGSFGFGMGGGGRFWLGLAAWVPLAALIAGLVLIQQWNDRQQVLAAAEIDAVLLADDLPPAAWTDPGFREYLKAPPP